MNSSKRSSVWDGSSLLQSIATSVKDWIRRTVLVISKIGHLARSRSALAMTHAVREAPSQSRAKVSLLDEVYRDARSIDQARGLCPGGEVLASEDY